MMAAGSSNDTLTAPVLCLAGPTASGKSAAAMAVAAMIPSEIVSVDSAQVYRGMDIGTAKPGASERAAVAHHLIDLIDPLENYSAGRFTEDARQVIAEIRSRGRLPILVGGTMLYFKALFDGLDEIPSADPDTRRRIRDEIDREAAALGWPSLHAELERVDPVTAARLSLNDSQRIQRALEVFRTSGQPLSSFYKVRHDAPDVAGAMSSPGMLLVSLEPADRSWLHRRVGERFELMMSAGFLGEVRSLRARGDLTPDLPSMRCVGYRQLLEAFDRDGDPLPAGSLAKAVEAAKTATRQLAKRQMTWLRSMPQRVVVPCDAPDVISQVTRLVQARIAGES